MRNIRIQMSNCIERNYPVQEKKKETTYSGATTNHLQRQTELES